MIIVFSLLHSLPEWVSSGSHDIRIIFALIMTDHLLSLLSTTLTHMSRVSCDSSFLNIQRLIQYNDGGQGHEHHFFLLKEIN